MNNVEALKSLFEALGGEAADVADANTSVDVLNAIAKQFDGEDDAVLNPEAIANIAAVADGMSGRSGDVQFGSITVTKTYNVQMTVYGVDFNPYAETDNELSFVGTQLENLNQAYEIKIPKTAGSAMPISIWTRQPVNITGASGSVFQAGSSGTGYTYWVGVKNGDVITIANP